MVVLLKIKEISIIFLIIIFFSVLSFKNYHDNSVNAQSVVQEQPSTANVTILGFLGDVIVQNRPVNFTIGDGLSPGTDDNPKANGPLPYPPNHGYIEISANSSTNVIYNITINASDMVDSFGKKINVSEIKVNSSDCGIFTPIELSYTTQLICQETQPKQTVKIYFYLDVPVGQYNNTYDGEFWVYAYSNRADPNNNNRTWHGTLGNTTAKIKTVIDIVWELKPVDFGTLIPGSIANATKDRGFPTNISSTPLTNVYIDLYINGTDLFNLADPTFFIGSDNVTYSNATDANADGDPENWPDGIKPLTHSFIKNTWGDTRFGKYYEFGGDFPNFGLIPNNTYRVSWWNITIPTELITGQSVPGGDYGGDLRAKAVDANYNPNV
jgi:hypothetical protein